MALSEAFCILGGRGLRTQTQKRFDSKTWSKTKADKDVGSLRPQRRNQDLIFDEIAHCF